MGGRIHAIDAIRGFCLLNIFVNHVSFGVVNQLSPSRILFFDSADAFVLLAGISAYLAYGPRPGGHTRIDAARILRRGWTIYLCNVLIIVASVAVLVLAESAQPSSRTTDVTGLIREHGIGYAWHLATLQQSVAYSVVLRLYVFLMLATPLYVWLGTKRFWYPLALAAVLWVAAGHFELVERDSLTGLPLMLTVLPWNLPFALGIALGAAIRAEVALPRSKVATAMAVIAVLAAPICFVVATRLSPEVMVWVESRDNDYWLGASKRFQSPLRVASLIGVTWLFIAFARAPVIRLVHNVSPTNILCLLGRNSLRIYTIGAIGAVALYQGLLPLVIARPDLKAIVDIAAVATGFTVMAWFAKRGALQSPRYSRPLFHTTRPTISSSSSATSIGG